MQNIILLMIYNLFGFQKIIFNRAITFFGLVFQPYEKILYFFENCRPFSLSLTTTYEISVDFFSSSYLDVSVH